jgi:hypothetical protein
VRRGAISLLWLAAIFVTGVSLPFAGFLPAQASHGQATVGAESSSRGTNIVIGSATTQSGVKRLGINLSGQTYYDSGQMLRNLTFRNPGFEGETWQSILHCKWITDSTCTDENQYAVWPAGFLDGASFQVITGAARGSSGLVISSTPVGAERGVTLTLRGQPSAMKAGDFILIRIEKPGDAQAGWWTGTEGGASFSTEFKDLPPVTEGRQALRIESSRPGQSAKLTSYFDSYAGHSFVQLRGDYTLTFRAKALSGGSATDINIQRLDTTHGMHSFLSRTVSLSPEWKTYQFAFHAAEGKSALGTVQLTFNFRNASVLMDDVALTAVAAPDNPTAFRDEVVRTLRDLHPGVLRYMDNGTNFGSSLDNMIAPPFARRRAGSSTQEKLREDIPIGLHEFLVLAKAVGAEPWYSMPPGSTPKEAADLIEYLGGSASTPYGSRRAALGQNAPWTEAFPVIHLELGNEMWNNRSFAGSTIADPTAFGQRASAVFAAMRAAPGFRAAEFDLILGSWANVPWWTGQELAANAGQDTVAVAPYLFAEFKDASSDEAIFGPMLAQPELIDSEAGYMGQQRDAVRKAVHPSRLAIYEVNLGTMSGSASQSDINKAIPSLGAGLAVVDHMLLMLRDLRITTQCLFSLPEFVNDFMSASGPKLSVPLWGAVVDMGGSTDLRRPQYLALQVANSVILPSMLETHLTGVIPTWDQPKSANDGIEKKGAKMIQTFAFQGEGKHSLIILNLSRSEALPVTFSGSNRPKGAVLEKRLTSAHITDSNESAEKISVVTRSVADFDSAHPYLLPPFSMTSLEW